MNILVIDDDQLVCTSLKIILESDKDIHVVAMGNDGNDAISLYEKHLPDVLLMDIRMKNMNGIEAFSVLVNKFPDIKVLFLTTFLDDEYIVKAISLGAKGYIIKQSYEHIIPALKAVYSGQNVYGNEIITRLPQLITRTDAFDYSSYDITSKEYEIIALVADGLSNKEIADRLVLSEGTVRNYLSIILEKLELRDRTQLAIFYLQHK